MSARVWLFLVWALAAASAVTWALKLGARPAAVPATAVLAQGADAPRGDWTRVLGVDAPPAPPAAAAPPPVDPRFVLLGVISPRRAGATGQGLALIAVDDRPARAFRVGAVVDGERVLQSVGPRSATIGPAGGPAQVSLTLPPLPEAARGVPAPAGAAPGAFPAPPGAAYPAPAVPSYPPPAAPMLSVTPPGGLPPGAYPLPGQPVPGMVRPPSPSPPAPPVGAAPTRIDMPRPGMLPPGAVDANGAALR